MLFTAELDAQLGNEVSADLLKDRVRGGFIASTSLLITDGWKSEKAIESFENWKKDGFMAATTSVELYQKMGEDCILVLEYQEEILNDMRKRGAL